MLNKEAIVERLKKYNLRVVAEETGVSYARLIAIVKREFTNEELEKLAEFLNDNTN